MTSENSFPRTNRKMLIGALALTVLACSLFVVMQDSDSDAFVDNGTAEVGKPFSQTFHFTFTADESIYETISSPSVTKVTCDDFQTSTGSSSFNGLSGSARITSWNDSEINIELSVSGTPQRAVETWINADISYMSDSEFDSGSVGFYASAQITVEEPKTTPVTSVSISGPSSVDEGDTITLKATTSPSSATNRHVSWSIQSGSANGSISSQSDSSTGGSCVLRGSSEGSITVRATADDGSGSYATKTITVNAPAKTYYLKYDANGGYNAPSQQSGTSTSGECDFRVSGSEPSRSGYTFLGWSSSSSASSAQYTAGDYVTSYGTKVLYAVWEQNLTTYHAKVYFNANGGSGAPSTMTHSKDMVSPSGSHTFSIPYTEPTKAGSKFLGWSTSSGAFHASYSGGNSISVSYDSSITLYAVWQQLSITISGTPDPNGIVGSTWSYTPSLNYGGCSLSVTGPSWLHVSGGKIVGTPSEPGTYNFTVKAMKNGYTTGSQSFSVTVLSALSFQSSPTGGAIIYAV